MAFTYLGDLSTDTDKVRFYVGDTVSGRGPRPESANFTDAEIAALISLEGGWQSAVAGCFEALSAAWQDSPVFGVSELGTTHGRIAEGYAAKAREWRARAGSSVLSGMGTVKLLRKDAYSDDVNALEN